MPLARPRANSLHIPIPNTAQWRAPRPPTPRRSTFPQYDPAADAPPVPPLSYWEPDTPEALISPLSPRNPFLSPPPLVSPSALFPMASPLLPASPLSIFDRVISPLTPTFLFPRSPPVAGTPTSRRFLCPRTPPVPPSQQPRKSQMRAVRRHSTMGSVPQSEEEKMQLQQQYDMLIQIRDKLRMQREIRNEMVEKNGLDVYPFFRTEKETRGKKKEIKRLLKQKSFRVLKDVFVGA